MIDLELFVNLTADATRLQAADKHQIPNYKKTTRPNQSS